MKKIIVSIVLIIILFIGLVTTLVINDPIKAKGDISITIEEGESLYGVLDRLKVEDKIRAVSVIKVYLRVSNANTDVLPGKYILNDKMSLREILDVFTKQNIEGEVAITIPEGYNIEDIADELDRNDICSKEEFINAVKNYPVPEFVNIKIDEAININTNKPCKEQGIRYNLEGYLYPDTYNIRKGTSPEIIIEMMLERFKNILLEAEKVSGRKINAANGELQEIIIKASIIEKEGKIDKDRPIIASVIENRLKDNMPLQMDATTIYAQGKHKDVVTTKDTLGTDSAYNTYVVKGLPVGPISNPGYKSILAAIMPEKTNYIYYLVEPGTDSHYFTKDYDDFIKKQKEWNYID